MDSPFVWSFLLCCAVLSTAGCMMDPYSEPDDDSGDDDTSDDTSADWVTIPGGVFDMGSNLVTNEGPIHSVTVPTFEIWRTEVTVSQYGACVEADACNGLQDLGACNWNEAGYEAHPVNCLGWQQAVDYCEWIGGRLPSEAEWEYAARGGGKDITYPWGNEEATCDYAVMEGGGWGCGTGRTWPVCSKPQGNTDLGLCDMSGNVYEWVQDWFHDDYAADGGAPEDGSAWEQPAGTERVSRGGGCKSEGSFLRAANRDDSDPDSAPFYRGFRCAR